MRVRGARIAKEFRAAGAKLSTPLVTAVVVVLLVAGAAGVTQRDRVELGTQGVPVLSFYTLTVGAAALAAGLVLAVAVPSWRSRIAWIFGMSAVLAGLGYLIFALDAGGTPPPRETSKPVPNDGLPPTGEGGIASFWSWEVIAAIAAVAAILLLVLLRRPPATGEEEPTPPAEWARHASAAVSAGRASLRNDDTDDTRARVIGCYAAMEAALAQRGVRRRIADTPTELLHRATRGHLLDADAEAAAVALIELFHRARFSTQPLPHMARVEAESALTRLGEELDRLANAQDASR